MNTFRLRIASPKGIVYDSETVKLCVRSVTGDVAILAGHIPYVTTLKDGICKITDSDGNENKAEYTGGLLTVSKENTNLLVTKFEWK